MTVPSLIDRTDSRTSLWVLVAVLILAALLSINELGAKSLWVDELFTVELAHESPSVIIKRTSDDLHPPLYFLLIRASSGFFGYSDLALRWPSVVWGLLSLCLVYQLGRTLGSSKVGVGAALLLGVSPFWIQFSRMGRYYSLTAFLGLLACWLWVRFLRCGGWRSWIAYVLVASASLYTFYLAIAMLLPQAAYAVLRKGQEHRRLAQSLAAQVIVILSLAPWLKAISDQSYRSAQVIEADLAGGPAGYLLKLAYPLYSYVIGETLFPWHPAALLGMSLAAVLGLRGLYYWHQRNLVLPMTLFLALPLCATAFVLTIFSPATPFVNAPSRAMFAAPFLFIILAGGFVSLQSRRSLFLLLVAGWLVVDGIALHHYYSNRDFHNPTYVIPAREMANEVGRQVQSGDVVISDWDSAFAYYYNQGQQVTPHFFTDEAETIEDYVSRHANPRVWLITIGRDKTRASTPVDLIHWLERNYVLVYSKGYAEQDPVYRRIKERLLHRPAYQYKAVVQLYGRSGADSLR